MHGFLSARERLPYALPVISALAVIVTLPPFNLWSLILVALAPFYFFVFQEKSTYRVFVGALFFGLLFAGYLFSITLSSFTWIPEAHLFSSMVRLLSIPAVLFTSISTALVLCAITDKHKVLTALERSIIFGIFFAVTEWVLSTAFIGFNYGSIAYAASHLSILRFMASIGGTSLVTFTAVFGNAALAEALRFIFQTKKRDPVLLIPFGIFAAIICASFAYQCTFPAIVTTASSSISVAIIQDQTRKESEAFGTVVRDSFQFPLLEKHLKEASVLHPDIIIYPFSPWVGTIADKLDNSGFTKNVIGMDYDTFGKWLVTHIPPKTTLVTWDTHLEQGNYFGQIDFWKGGKLVNSYKKVTLFPFMDYTPQWSGRLGVYSLPYDGSAGTSTAPITVGNIVIGNLVCSEISHPASGRENGKDADVVFAIGSEAMFTNPLVSEFNLLNAQLRATESGRMFIRANKFGPSAIIDTRGNILKEASPKQSGILFVEIPSQTEHRTTLYSSITEYPFLILFVGYAAFLLKKKSRKSSESR